MTRTPLAGGSYVFAPDDLAFRETGGWREATVAGREHGARALGQRLVLMDRGESAWRTCADAETVLFALAGEAMLDIGERSFHLQAGAGAFVAPWESFRVRCEEPKGVRLTLTVCPEAEPELKKCDSRFDFDYPVRIVAAADQKRHSAGDRFYQLLADSRIGCANVTQFIGGIPKSRAPEHYHDYEEAITILEGEGRMHTGALSAPVGPGSMIFLTHGQRHSLECTSEGGMRLVGVFHPSGSPAVSYE